MTVYLKFSLLVLLTLMIACKSTAPTKTANEYCMEYERDTFKQCFAHRKEYLEERKKVITQFRENKQSCEIYAKQKSGEANSCTNNTMSTQSARTATRANVSRNCDPHSQNQNSSVHTIRSNMTKSEIEKDCMLNYGWKNHRSYREEVKVVDNRYGYENNENN